MAIFIRRWLGASAAPGLAVTGVTAPVGPARAVSGGIGAPGGEAGQTTRIVGTASGRCVDIPDASTANGAQARLWDCHGGVNQRWSLPG
ncbi:RICIN domain-containing protein [Micromonospora sp. WMMD882]|uniref:RICIN domain-containing protein n=1 Tax=Micromonospora sp. WMMD882 TaxID=3015151 RepID=UPI00248D2469|nr:RICIN domain-containing protein [Micromonospora sp. WMMD882]WBB80491.1 RICIN domain-containing protein [Micromonospora sp. WMMD882]